MSDSEEKTEQPTAHKLKQARKKGEVAQSKELTSSVSFVSVFMMLWLGAEFWYSKLRAVLSAALDAIMVNSHEPLNSSTVTEMATQAMWIIGPVFILATVAGMLTAFAQTRGVFSTEPLIVKFQKLNPGEALKNLFSTKQLGTLLQMIAKLCLICTVMVMTIKNYVGPMIMGIYGDGGNTLVAGLGAMRALFGACGAVFVVLASIDFLQQYFEHIKKNRMSKSERKRENKDQQGDPHLRSELKARGREIVDAPMGVARANVVVTNPTHFAVALYYEDGKVELPIVVAKGEDAAAFQIRTEARQHAIPVLESPPLARMLYAQVPLGDAIAPEHVDAVAEVFRWVNGMKNPRRSEGARGN